MLSFISKDFIDLVLEKTDLVEFIGHYVPLVKKGDRFVACCPFHQEKTPSFYVSASKQFYHCFGCKENGNAISFAMQYLKQNFQESVSTLANRAGISLENEHTKDNKKLYDLMQKVCDFYQQQLRNNLTAINYLKGRLLTGKTALNYQIGFAKSDWHNLEKNFLKDKELLIKTGMLIEKANGSTYDRYRNRIMLPIQDKQGRIIGFGGRALDNNEKPKYLNSPETVLFSKHKELYGLNFILQNKESAPDWILVVEGYFDVIMLAQNGIHNAVATLGTATSSFHIALLARYTKKIVFCFDGDSAGNKAAAKALEESIAFVDTGVDIRFIFLPTNEDPDSFISNNSKEVFLSLIETAMPLHQYLIKTLSKNLDLTIIAGKTRLVHLIKPYFVKINDSIYKSLFLEELAKITGIASEKLQNLLYKSVNTNPIKILPKNNTERSSLNLAIAILLQNPELFNQIDDNIITLIKNLEEPILLDIINIIKQEPNLTSAQLLERWRDREEFAKMSKLTAWEHAVPKQAIFKEWHDIIFLLQKQKYEKKIKKLMSKLQEQTITQNERIELQNLLREKHT